jgi:hypothetical protein
MLPSPDEFAALVVAYPEIPDLAQSVSAEEAGRMIRIQPSSIRIPADGDGPRTWRLDTLVAWRASLPGRGSNAGRPPADIGPLLAELRERVLGDGTSKPLTVVRVQELLGLGAPLARRVYVEFTGRQPVHGRVAGNLKGEGRPAGCGVGPGALAGLIALRKRGNAYAIRNVPGPARISNLFVKCRPARQGSPEMSPAGRAATCRRGTPQFHGAGELSEFLPRSYHDSNGVPHAASASGDRGRLKRCGFNGIEEVFAPVAQPGDLDTAPQPPDVDGLSLYFQHSRQFCGGKQGIAC